MVLSSYAQNMWTLNAVKLFNVNWVMLIHNTLKRFAAFTRWNDLLENFRILFFLSAILHQQRKPIWRWKWLKLCKHIFCNRIPFIFYLRKANTGYIKISINIRFGLHCPGVWSKQKYERHNLSPFPITRNNSKKEASPWLEHKQLLLSIFCFVLFYLNVTITTHVFFIYLHFFFVSQF